MIQTPPHAESDTHSPPTSPTALHRRADRLAWQRRDHRQRKKQLVAEIDHLTQYLEVSDGVTAALETLNERLFQELLGVVRDKLTIALQEVLDQPLQFQAEVDFKRGAATVDFKIKRDGHEEDVYRGQGGSVANVLSVGLRMFALTSLDEAEHRRFLVLDEQDCWLRPDLVPQLVKIVHDAGRALGFQVIMISHHDRTAFERHADKVYQFEPEGGEVKVFDATPTAVAMDPDESDPFQGREPVNR